MSVGGGGAAVEIARAVEANLNGCCAMCGKPYGLVTVQAFYEEKTAIKLCLICAMKVEALEMEQAR